MNRLIVVGLVVLASLGSAPAWAQGSVQEQPAASPTEQGSEQAGDGSSLSDAEQQELEKRTGTTYRSWQEMLEDWMTPRPVAKDTIVRIDDKYAYPHAAVAFKMEIVKEEGDTVWLRGLPPEDPESALHDMWLNREYEQMAYTANREWEEKYGVADFFVDFSAEIVPPPFMDGLDFAEVRSGLPNRGLWQMNFVVVDMNGDGIPDVVTPPSRKGDGRPGIFLGSGGGTFAAWKGVTWPGNVPFDYGGIVVEDFDRDGHQDIVLAIHFKGQYVLYGNGEGDFSRARLLPTPDPRVSSRAVSAADFDGDGRPDVVFLAEIDYDLGTSLRLEDAGTVWTVLNTEAGWKAGFTGLPLRVIGDNLESIDVDTDGRPDLVLASNATDWRRLVFLNRGAEGWVGPLHRGVLSNAQHPDVATQSAGGDVDLFMPFIQFLAPAGQTIARTGLIRYRADAKGVDEKGEVLVMDDRRFDPWFRVAAGDLNGDGRVDLVASRKDGEVVVFIQSETGDLYREESPDLVSKGRAYDIRLVDLDGNGLDDVVIAFADEQGAGGIGVWLTEKR